MPSKSKKQHNLMAAVANNPKFAKKVGIPQSVGEDYVEADKGRKFRSGGMAGCGTKRMNMGGKVGMHKMPDGTMMKDSEHKMAMGGMAMGLVRATREAARLMVVPSAVAQMTTYKSRVKTDMPRANPRANPMAEEMSNPRPPKGYKVGGKVRGDGICKKGHTKGRMV
jgi:hypothetical protein